MPLLGAAFFICISFIYMLYLIRIISIIFGGLSLADTQNIKTIKQALNEYGVYTGLTKGDSMEPLIHNQQDTIIIVKPQGRLKKYDIPDYVTKSGKYIMHRIVKVCPDHYVIIGDNRLNKEYVTDDMIVGKLKAFYKNGKAYIDLEENRLYKVYSRVWVALYPLRPIYHFSKRAFNKIKRILKRGNRA